jgi:hypothetical protein
MTFNSEPESVVSVSVFPEMAFIVPTAGRVFGAAVSVPAWALHSAGTAAITVNSTVSSAAHAVL